MPQSSRTVLIDTDTASDDAVALIMALRSSAVEVKAITVVAGNVPVEQGIQNALFTAELCGSAVPVFGGEEKPLRRPLQTAHWFHGQDGLGDQGYLPVQKIAETEHAISALIRVIHENPGIELITLGPLTNLAVALLRNSDWVANVSRCVIMGGAPCTEGNVTPAAEFNFWVDPEAAQIVFRSGLPIEMIGWQLSRGEAVVHEHEIKEIAALKTAFADFAIASNSVARQAYLRQTGEIGITLPDPVAMSVLLNPALALEASCHLVEIEVQSELTRGMSVVDRLQVANDSRNREIWAPAIARNMPASICWKLDTSGWKQALLAAMV